MSQICCHLFSNSFHKLNIVQCFSAHVIKANLPITYLDLKMFRPILDIVACWLLSVAPELLKQLNQSCAFQANNIMLKKFYRVKIVLLTASSIANFPDLFFLTKSCRIQNTFVTICFSIRTTYWINACCTAYWTVFLLHRYKVK
jgi:hypothetical protein